MRKEVPEIGWGDFDGAARPATPAVLALRYDWRNNCVLFLHNLDAQAARDRASRRARRARTAACWSTCSPTTTARRTGDGQHRLVLEAYGYRWYRVGGLDYLLKRSEI